MKLEESLRVKYLKYIKFCVKELDSRLTYEFDRDIETCSTLQTIIGIIQKGVHVPIAMINFHHIFNNFNIQS